MLQTILQALYYFLPAYFSNMAPVLFGKVNIFPQPVDSNKTFNGNRIFGKNKTWGGLLYATVTGTLVFYLQQKLYENGIGITLTLINYTKQPLLLGGLLASGAIMGDLVKSFIKRRLNKEPSSPWFPWDQLDLVIGAFVFSSFIFIPNWKIVMIIIIATPLLHYATNVIGYKIGLKKVMW